MTAVRLFCAAMLLALQQLHGAETSAFATANQAYAAGDSPKAIDVYEQLVREGRRHANLFYDLGNAWYRAGDDGKAILSYERALALDPHHPEAQANLRLVRDHARALDLQPAQYERYVASATPRALTIFTAISFWIAVFLAISFAISRSRTRIVLLVCSILLCCGATAAVYLRETGAHGNSLAIVIGKNVQARVATADTSASVLVLPAGSEVNVLSPRGDWTYVALPNEQRGWVPAKAIELVRL